MFHKQTKKADLANLEQPADSSSMNRKGTQNEQKKNIFRKVFDFGS